MRYCSILLASLLSLAVGAQTPLYSYRGAVDATFGGEGMAAIGDIDLDGFADFAFGESGFDGAAGVDCGRVTVFSGFDGSVIYRVEGLIGAEWFGTSIAGLQDDINGDGVPEWLAGSPYGGLNGPNSGTVRVLDGATGLVIRTHFGAADANGDGFGDHLGYSIESCGDMDGDGEREYILGAVGDYFSGVNCAGVDQGGYFEIRSGATGAVIHFVPGAAGCGNAGVSSSELPDLDGDGIPDFLLGWPESTGTTGRIEVRRGSDATVFRTHIGAGFGDFLGSFVSVIGDVDNDGVDDYAGGADNLDFTLMFFGPGYVNVYSGATGLILQTVNGNFNGDGFGRGLGDVGDWDGDGTDDFYVAAPYDDAAGLDAGRIAVISGATWAPLFEVYGEAPGDFIGFAARSGVIDDLDGDGLPEIMAATWANDLYGNNRGVLTVHSSQNRMHWLSQNLLSINNPGQVEFLIDAGPAAANAIYVVLGSLTGTNPPTVAGPYVIPLVSDAWFAQTLMPATSPINNGFGNTDAAGQAVANAVLPAGLPPAVAGTQHWSAAVVVDGGGNVFISEAAVFSVEL